MPKRPEEHHEDETWGRLDRNGSSARSTIDNRTCPGYKAPLKLIQYQPPVDPRHKASKRGKEHITTKVEAKAPRTLHAPMKNNLSIILDTFEYYNSQVIPVITPACMPWKRELVPDTIPWQVLPSVLRHALTATLRSFQVGSNAFDPLSQPELCYHREQALKELRLSLENAVKDRAGVAFGMIIMMVGGDMMLTPGVGRWTLHLEAARNIIRARGGFVRCINSLPVNTTVLLTFAVVDITTLTTSRMSSISHQAVQEQQEFHKALRENEGQVMANITPCPVEILQILAQANMLRAGSHACGHSGHKIDEADVFGQLAVSLGSFDASFWAARLLRSGHSQSQRQEVTASEAAMCAMTSLAECYRAAAALYLLLLCSAFAIPDGDRLIQWSQTISANIESLLRDARDNRNPPLEAQLWKTIKWPLVISAYIKVNWKLDSVTNASYGELLRLQTIAMKLRSRQMLQAVEEIRRSSKRHELDGGGSQTWDDGFDYKWTFVP
ncbi:hypothetical protein AC579_8523 [Pseudocercospora musae]|uniref:Transcription factor domain-containing protein n=1 Tax=Pseudocercospora musae TaxID=113226 RepID=A0A139I9S2_9PEZI|nr:hypothetical protein AC579_8523 [Pseudocercospora musae]